MKTGRRLKNAISNPLENAQPGDILLFNRATGLNRIITWFTKSPFYHVGIYAGKGFVVEARPRGVVRRDLNGPDGDKSFVVIPASEHRGEAALKWAESQVGDGYDPFNVLGIVFERLFICCGPACGLPNHYTCGEFVAGAFEQAGVDLFPDRETASVVPADFARYLPRGKTYYHDERRHDTDSG